MCHIFQLDIITWQPANSKFNLLRLIVMAHHLADISSNSYRPHVMTEIYPWGPLRRLNLLPHAAVDLESIISQLNLRFNFPYLLPN
jgi:hypothetical protein